LHLRVALGALLIDPLLGREARSRVESLQVKPIATVRPRGKQVQISGRARARRTFLSPITGEAVIGYRVRIEVLSSNLIWRQVADVTRLHAFEVDDGSGEAMVHWLGSQVLVETRPTTELNTLLTRQTFCRPLALNTGMLYADPERTRFWATDLAHGSEVFVCGRPIVRASQHGVPRGYRELPRQLLIKSTGARPVLVATCNRETLLDTLDTRYLD